MECHTAPGRVRAALAGPPEAPVSLLIQPVKVPLPGSTTLVHHSCPGGLWPIGQALDEESGPLDAPLVTGSELCCWSQPYKPGVLPFPNPSHCPLIQPTLPWVACGGVKILRWCWEPYWSQDKQHPLFSLMQTSFCRRMPGRSAMISLS